MTAKDLKEKILGKTRADDFDVIGLSGKGWWYVRDGEQIPEEWALKPIESIGLSDEDLIGS